MKSFFWKFVICVVPCLLAAWVTASAVGKYFAGESGGFKLGVDLVGGTILVYEIDLRKQDVTDQTKKAFDPTTDINVLAEALKKRIDPNDLYNIVIRPAGGEGRVEIILPTGGTYRSEKADNDWQELVAGVAAYYKISDPKDLKKLEVPRGRIFELADAIQLLKAQNRWSERLLNSQEAWDRMTAFTKKAGASLSRELTGQDMTFEQLEKTLTAVEELTASLVGAAPKIAAAVQEINSANEAYNKSIKKNEDDPQSAQFYFGDDLVNATVEDKKGRKVPAPQAIRALWQKGKPVDIDELVKLIDSALATTRSATNEVVVKNWVKQHAWHQLILKAMNRNEKAEDGTTIDWTWLKVFEPEMNRIPADNNEQLAGFIQAGGTFVGQAGLFALESIIGANPLENYKSDDEGTGPRLQPYKPVKDFIDANYGPSHRSILKEIQKRAKDQRRDRDLTVEEVQRIKEQVARVGLLEFRILANEKDDAAGIKAATETLESGRKAQEIKDNAEKGLPPPGPYSELKNAPAEFQINLARGAKSWVTYSWVELSRQQRRELNLDNAAKDDPRRDFTWKQAETKTDRETFKLHDGTGKPFFKGALFTKRLCRDRNLNPEERDSKKYEYFVLTRDPEFEQTKKGEILFDRENKPVRTPRIDGGYLTSAAAGTSQDLRPAVHFAFNSAGADLFGAITGKNVPDEGGSDDTRAVRHLAIILDGEVMSAPTIQSTIRDRGQISGNFTQKEVEALVNTLRAGRLPATLKPDPVSESTMGPTLGQDTIEAGILSIVLAFFLVLAFMVVYYRFAGFVASVALLANLLLTIGFMAAVQATFTLAGLAGLVLTVGMAVDANVLIYERLREERDRGASLANAIRSGYERSLPTIIDTHLSCIFTAIVLYIVGNDQLKGFGISLAVGLVISLFTSLYMTRVMFDFFLAKGWLRQLSMLRFFAKPNIDFMAIRKPMFLTSVTLCILGFALFFGRAPFNIDFVGGTAFGSQLKEPVDQSELRDLTAAERQEELLAVDVVELPPLTSATRYVAEGSLTAAKEKEKDKDKKKETPKTTAQRAGSNLYQLTYKVGRDAKDKERIVTLLYPPDLSTKEEREEAVRLRASKLPDVAVEQLFPSFAKVEGDKSTHFLIRTSEREPELVQAALDRLLRDSKGETLLKQNYIEWGGKLEDRLIRVDFYNANPDDYADNRAELESKHRTTGSPLFIKSLFNKELLKAYGTTDRSDLPGYEVHGEGSATPEGGYQSLVIKFEKVPQAEERERIRKALDATVASFNRYISPDRLENFDSQLATETRYRALWAILASWVALLIYVWFRFGNWTFGLAAVLCLVHDVFFTLGAIAICHYIVVYLPWLGDALMLRDFKVDLNTVAALLTLVGYSINDKIVVYDRMREVRGKNPLLTPKIINDSINQSLSRTLLTGISVLLVLLVLYIFGGEGIHLFAFVMGIGMIVGTYSSIYVASPLLLMFGEGQEKERTGGAARPTPEGAPA